MILRFSAATLVAAWIFWQLPFSAVKAVKLPELSAFTPFAETTTDSGETPALVFYRRAAAGQYDAYGISGAGNLVRSIRLPGETVTKADGTTIALNGKEGYITAPESGAFYIWYPQIGQQVFVFNERGQFLWEKEESHYLHALPRGRYIMAAAGDHSRLVFMNPDFKTQADFQGVLFTRFITDDDPDLKTAQVCLGSLDGEVIIAHLDSKVFFRAKIGYALKALQCDFATGEMAAIVERTVEVEKARVQKDFLLRMKFSLDKPKDAVPQEKMRPVEPELRTLLTAELPIRTVTASPMVLGGDSICFLQAAPQDANSSPGLAIYYTPGKKSSPRLYLVPPAKSATGQGASGDAPDLWKANSIMLGNEDACMFSHRSGRVLIANRRGILLDRQDLPAERLLVKNNVAYLQTEKGILSLR